MSAKAKEIIERCHDVTRKGRRHKTTRFLSHAEIENLKEKKSVLEAGIEEIRTYRKGNPATLQKKIVAIEDKMEDEAPPALSGEYRDAVAKEETRVRAILLEGIPTQEEMRRNPPGTVAKLTRWQASKKNLTLAWKNLRRVLEPDNDDPDLSNLERYRPSMMNTNGAATHMPGAQIAGHHAMTPAAKRNWPDGLGANVNSALAQSERTSGGDYGKPNPKAHKPSKFTPEQRAAASARMKLVNQRKREERLARLAATAVPADSAPATE